MGSPFLQIVLNPDNSLTRPFLPESPPDNHNTVVLSKDIVFNSTGNTSHRLYVPQSHTEEEEKLPIILFFHGGGFVICSPATTEYHRFCENMAADLPAVVLSVDYRLAPEFRLPAAYEDAMDAIRWVGYQAVDSDRCLPELKYVDFSRCFLMGGSSGGNIVYHAGLQASKDAQDGNLAGPFQVAGLILHQPSFSSEKRMESELQMADDPIIPLRIIDFMWELSLPVGSNKDHEYSNPSQTVKSAAAVSLPKCLVTGCSGDPFIDWQREVARLLEEEGVEVQTRFSEGEFHAAELFIPEVTRRLLDDVRAFVTGKVKSVIQESQMSTEKICYDVEQV